MVNYLQDIFLLEQEREGHSRFTGKLVVTAGFQETFGTKALVLAIQSLAKILSTYRNPDHFQVCKYEGVKYYVIDDGDVVTCLLPEEY